MKHPEGVPANAEQVEFGAIFRTVHRESKFLPGVNAIAVVIECPRCKTIHENPAPLQTVECDCGICVRYDFGTWVWDNKRRASNAA